MLLCALSVFENTPEVESSAAHFCNGVVGIDLDLALIVGHVILYTSTH